jgi:hypothetical protein
MTVERPAKALTTIRKGKKHSRKMAEKSMARLMTSTAMSRRTRCPAEPAEYRSLVRSALAWKRSTTCLSTRLGRRFPSIPLLAGLLLAGPRLPGSPSSGSLPPAG